MFYNEHISSDYMFDTIMAPAFWFLDQFTAILGPLFVLLVVFLTVKKRKSSSEIEIYIVFIIAVLSGADRLLDWSSLLPSVQESIHFSR